MNAITRPVVRYHGSKFRIAEWVISHFPVHDVYVEAFGGGGSVLLQKPRAKLGEIYNDLDEQIVQIFRVLRDPEKARRLEEVLRLTPFAREELEGSYAQSGDEVEQVRRSIVRAFMGFGADSITRGHRTGFRSRRASTGQNAWPAWEWSRYPDAIGGFCERLQGVTIENRSWEQLLDQYDSPGTLFYLDPPYLLSTRGNTGSTPRRGYRFEFTDEQHIELLQAVNQCSGMVVLSGYPSELYEEHLSGWDRFERKARAEMAFSRVEALWVKPNTLVPQTRLFA